MKLNPYLFVIIFLICVCIIREPKVDAQPDKSTVLESKPKITIDDLNANNVCGRLGVPLGTIVRITGDVIDGKETRLRKYLGVLLLKIISVDGTKLTDPILMEFELRQLLSEDLEKPNIGTKFDFYVHETGSYEGLVKIPKASGVEEYSHSGHAFSFIPRVVIHKSNR